MKNKISKMFFLSFLLISLSLTLSSCSSEAAREAARKKEQHQAETGDRINKSQKDTDPLFKEIEE